MRKCYKFLIILIIFLFFINNISAIQSSNQDFRMDFGWIAFNESVSGKQRSYGSWISNLYENLKFRLGILKYDKTPPSITLISPENNYNTEEGYVNYSYNVSDYSNIKNCSLYLFNGDLISSIDSSIEINSTQSFYFNIQHGSYRWQINCSDIWSNVNGSEVRNIILLKSTPGSAAPASAPAPTITYLKYINISYEKTWLNKRENNISLILFDNFNQPILIDNISIESNLKLKEIREFNKNYTIIFDIGDERGIYEINITAIKDSSKIAEEINVRVKERILSFSEIINWFKNIDISKHPEYILFATSIITLIFILIVVIVVIVRKIKEAIKK